MGKARRKPGLVVKKAASAKAKSAAKAARSRPEQVALPMAVSQSQPEPGLKKWEALSDAARATLGYDPLTIEDASGDVRALSGAVGILGWASWDASPRPFEERLKDFLMAYPPEEPLRYCSHGLYRESQREWLPRDPTRESLMFAPRDGSPGKIDALLRRYALRRKGVVVPSVEEPEVKPQLQAMRERNHALRVLHGSVDVEAMDMDAAKAAYLEKQEKVQAAKTIRAARAGKTGKD